MNDRETGKPRGFGFIEFYDIPTAESAIRNLSGKDFKGRTIRWGRGGGLVGGWGGGAVQRGRRAAARPVVGAADIVTVLLCAVPCYVLGFCISGAAAAR